MDGSLYVTSSSKHETECIHVHHGAVVLGSIAYSAQPPDVVQSDLSQLAIRRWVPAALEQSIRSVTEILQLGSRLFAQTRMVRSIRRSAHIIR